MKPVAAPLRWSHQRLILTIAGVFIAQLAVIWVLGERADIKPGRTQPFKIQLSGLEGLAISTVPACDDPTLFALPQPRGFSGQAWLHVPDQVHPYHEWTAQPFWLALNTGGLGLDFENYLQNLSPLGESLVDKPEPQLYPVDSGIDDLLPNASQLLVGGDLSTRPILSQPAIPDWPVLEILSATVLQVAVSADGFVFTAAVVSESGSKAADQKALELVRGLRFKPLTCETGKNQAAAGVSFGQLIFQWRISPTATPVNIKAKP